jgi:hypothetical protein
LVIFQKVTDSLASLKQHATTAVIDSSWHHASDMTQ